MYPAPMNGALACVNINDHKDTTCVVMCKREFDFAFAPPLLFFVPWDHRSLEVSDVNNNNNILYSAFHSFFYYQTDLHVYYFAI